MNNIISVIFASDQETKLDNLALHRTAASLPFAGRYRCIDFTLSNLVNSQITSIGIVTRSNYSSLMDHIRMGRDWDLNRKNGGITVFPPYASNTSRNVFKGKIEALYGILEFFTKAPEDYVIVTNSNIIASIDFEDVFNEHIKSGADITIVSYTSKPTTSKRLLLELDANNKVIGTRITQTASDVDTEIGTNIYLMKKDILVEQVIDNFERGYIDFEKNIIQQNIDKLNIHAYHLTQHCAIIDDVKSYYAESMAVLNAKIRSELFDGPGGNVYTKVKDSVPTRYRDKAVVQNSLVADGCDINGTVINSILFRGVVVEEGAEIRNSIVMEGGIVKKDATLDYAITDKNVTITEDKHMSGTEMFVTVIPKNKTV